MIVMTAVVLLMILRLSRKAKEQLIIMLLVLLVMTAVQLIIFDFVQNCKIVCRSGAGVDILDPYRVEHFPKGLIFRLNTTTNR